VSITDSSTNVRRSIAQARNTADIVDAVTLARESGFEVAVKGGGHNVAGRGTIDGGLLIDLSLMKGIQVDVKNKTARVRAARRGKSTTAKRSCTAWPAPAA
jgi:FAD/FMN-containing dehydrogenase